MASKQEVIDMLYEKLANPSITAREFEDYTSRLVSMQEISD